MADFASIWSWVEKEMKLKIPSYVKDILRCSGYENCYTIATIEEDDLQYFQLQVRKGNVKFVDDESVKTALKGLPQEFEFSRGHQKLIMSAVNLVKDNLKDGVDGFDQLKVKNAPEMHVPSEKRKKIKRNQIQNELSEADTIKLHQKTLMEKAITSLHEYTRNLYAKNCAAIKATEPATFVDVKKHQEDKSKYDGKIRCPYCKKKLTVFHILSSGLGTWNTGNFDRHLKKVHVKNQEGKKMAAYDSEVREMDIDVDKVVDSVKDNLENNGEPIAFLKHAVEIATVSSHLASDIITLPSLVQYSETESDDDEEYIFIEVSGSSELKNIESCFEYESNDGSGKTPGVEDAKLIERADILENIEIKDLNVESTKTLNDQTEIDSNAKNDKILLFRNGYKSLNMKSSVITTENFVNYSKLSGLIKKYFEEFNLKQKSARLGDELYEDRNSILNDIFSDKYYQKSGNLMKNGKNTFIDCKTGIGGLFGRICFEMGHNYASAIELKMCSRCEKTRGTILPFISIDSKNVDLTNIQKSIRFNRSKDRLCPVCGRQCDVKTIYNEILVLEVEPNCPINSQSTVCIQKLTEFIKVEKTYELISVIQYKPGIQHFISHIKRTIDDIDVWKTFDDLSNHETDTDITEDILPYMLFYGGRHGNPNSKSAFTESLLSFFEQNTLRKPMIRKNLPSEHGNESKKKSKNDKQLNSLSAQVNLTGSSKDKSNESVAEQKKKNEKKWKY